MRPFQGVLSIFLSCALAFALPLRALAAELPGTLDKWTTFKAEKGFLDNIAGFGSYEDFFSPDMKHQEPLYVLVKKEEGKLTLKESPCRLYVEKGLVWNTYFAHCGTDKKLLTKSTLTRYSLGIGTPPKVVVEGKTAEEPKKEAPAETEEKKDDPAPEEKKDEPAPETSAPDAFSEALARLFPGDANKVPRGSLEFLIPKAEGGEKAFLDFLKEKPAATASELLEKYKVLDALGDSLSENDKSGLLAWLKGSKGVSDDDILDYYCGVMLSRRSKGDEKSKTGLEEATRESRVGLGAKGSVDVEGTRKTRFDGSLLPQGVVAVPAALPGLPAGLEAKCRERIAKRIADEQNKVPSGNPTTVRQEEVPPVGKTEKAHGKEITTDAEEKTGDHKKEMADLQRTMLGAAFGAVGFGMLGLILGGPFGFVVGAIGGGLLMGGITHLKNHPIGG